MPRGQSATGTYKCHACNAKPFNSISELRKHKWKAHKEIYKNNGNNWNRDRPSVKITQNGNKTTLAEAIQALKIKRDALSEIILELEEMQ